MEFKEKMEETFRNAPKEVQEKGIAVNIAMHRVRRATRQLSMWESELKNAGTALDLANTEYGEVSLRWDIDKNNLIDEKKEI